MRFETETLLQTAYIRETRKENEKTLGKEKNEENGNREDRRVKKRGGYTILYGGG